MCAGCRGWSQWRLTRVPHDRGLVMIGTLMVNGGK